MDFIIVGTAGHVDHGKTVLVRALTGIDTDRLQEEKDRGISIELGFAPLELPSGRKVGLVDVPGHERFIKQMLAGVGGMDLVILVIAADEGVMPQTREHLDIIELLQVKKGLVVISKIDLVEEDWLELVREDIEVTLEGTVFQGAPVVPVSVRNGKGLEELISVLDAMVAETPPKNVGGKVRLPVDRCFSATGFGTVVTGTLWSGRIQTGDTLEVFPQQVSSRVRTLQVHGKEVQEARAGQRVAVNLANISVEEVGRGSVLAAHGSLEPSYLLDVQLCLLRSASHALKNRARVRLYLGTAEVLGRVVLLDTEELEPGGTSLVQLVMEKAVAVMRGDRFVIRTYSPMHTVGGGVVIDPFPVKHKRFREKIINSLKARLLGDPRDLILETLAEGQGIPLSEDDLAHRTGLLPREFEDAVDQLKAEGEIISLQAETGRFLLDKNNFELLLQRALQMLEAYHRKFPLRDGVTKEELRTREFAKIPSRIFQMLLNAWAEKQALKLEGKYVSLPQFVARPVGKQEITLKNLENNYLKAGFQPRRWAEVKVELGVGEEEVEELLQYLLRQGLLVKISEELYLHCQHVERAQELLREHINRQGSINLGEARDLLNSTRKFVLPLLEYFDHTKFTRRVGDQRTLYSQ